jgi:DNA invertase Pin-like site-specific DNA recombinase
MHTAVIYTRVSSLEQAEGFSIDAQVKACTKKAKEKNLTIKKIFKDQGFSGTNMKRPVLQEMLEYCKKQKINYVIIHKLDRLARSIENHASIRTVLKSFNTDLISCTEKLGDKPHEMLLENIMASLAQYYTDNLKTEIHKGIRERFEQGHLGCPPFGYKASKKLRTMQIHPEDAQTVIKMYDLYLTGEYSFKNISDYIFEKFNIKTSSGKKFSKSKIQRILKDPVYIGKIKY